jgi:hypothetical protein
VQAHAFPARAFIQQWDGIFPPDYALVADELGKRGVPVIPLSTQAFLAGVPLTRSDLVVGDFMWTRHACEQLCIPMPIAPDYPAVLQPFLHRRVWRSTLGDVREFLASVAPDKPAQVFVKPAADAKAFSAVIEPRDQMLSTLLDGIPGVIDPLPASLPVFCAEVVEMVEEHRAYIVNGEIRAVCCYKPRSDGGASQLDMDVVREAVRLLCSSAEGSELKGCGVDFAVMRQNTADSSFITGLIEVNDGYSLGRYEGVSGVLIARWQELVRGCCE